MDHIKDNKMGIMPCGKLLISMSLPMMVSMLVQALYNIVDSIYVSHLSEDALTAVTLAFPVQALMIAVATGTGVGINAILSRRLGEKNFEEANNTAKNALFLAVLSWIAFALFGIFGAKMFFDISTENQIIREMGTSYLQICTIASVGIFMQVTTERLLQSTGNTFYNMFIQGAGAIINIILDPLFIFGLCGFPKMGVAGAAVATVIGQVAAMFLGIFFNITKNKEINLSLAHFRPSSNIIINIYKIGIPSMLMQSIISILTFCLNKILIGLSETAVSVFGIYFRLQSFVFMPVFGLTNGMIPIVAYNYGAGNKKRITETIKYSFIISVSIMVAGFLLFQFVPEQLLRIFKADENMVHIGTNALRIISLSFPFAGMCIIISSVFQAFGNGVLSLILAVVRQLVVILPVSYLFSLLYHDVNKVWFAFPISEVVSLIICLFLYRYIYDKHIRDLGKAKT